MVILSIIILLLLLGSGIAFYYFYRHYERLIQKEFRRAQKSEQLKSIFLNNVSHALRSPLNAIAGYSDMLLEENTESMNPAQVREMATQINNNTKEMLGFISNLMELSNFDGSIPTFTLIEVNLGELMASYRRETLNVAKPDVAVRLRTDLSPHCKVTLDTNLMHQLIMHLLTDAAKCTSQGDITILYGSERKGLKVTITYTGVAQTELVGEDIYSFLQREDALTMNKETSPLGISTCKAIIDFLEGELDIETENGRKTIATFWFPCKMRDRNKKA